MQRSAAKEEKKIDKEPNGSFSSLGSVVAKKWFVFFFFVNVLFAVVVCVCVVLPFVHES